MKAALAIFRLFLTSQFTIARLAISVGLALLGALLAFTISDSQGTVRIEDSIIFIAIFGVGILVALTALNLMSGVMGQLREDQTMVYLWLSPTSRFTMAVAAVTSGFVAAIPSIIVPLLVISFIASGSTQLVGYALIAGLAATIAYCAIFSFFGLISRFSTIIGILFVIVWEGLIVGTLGSGSTGFQRLSINAQARQILVTPEGVGSPIAGDLGIAGGGVTSAIVTLAIITLIGLGLSTWRLQKMEVA